MTKEGEDFILDLNLYLMSLGKSEKEVREFIEEAEEHLRLGEADGKTVRDIFGDSPEEYAKSVADEMSFSKKEFLESILMFMFGVFVWGIFSKIENGSVSFSKAEVMVYPLAYLVILLGTAVIANKFAFKDKKFIISFAILYGLNLASLVVVGILSKNSPSFLELNRFMVIGIIIISLIITLLSSIKMNYYIMFLPFICCMPNLIETFTNISFANIKIYVSIGALILSYAFGILETRRITKNK